MRTMDCTDIRVLLSGLIDDEVDGDTRHAAERHLAECAECRALIDEAESLNQLIVTSTAGADGIEPLSPDFIGNVLSRTVYARPTSRRSTTDWTSWLGWFAAAAALLMAVVLWFDDQRVTPEDIPVIRSASVSPNMQPSLHDYIYSSVLAIAPDGDYDEAADWSSLTRDDVDTLDSAALVLEMLLV